MTSSVPNLSRLSADLANPKDTYIPTSQFSFPQVSRSLEAGAKGIASLTHMGRTFRFRTNPNQFSWTYTLNKHVDPTYGGRVVQLLSTKIDDFTVEADCGGGRWEYANAIARFLRDVMINQRNGIPATFEYTTRGWKLNVFIVSIPFEDAVGEVLRTFSIQMKVQEDVSKVMSRNSLRMELSKLQNGIGFQRNAYNDPTINAAPGDSEQGFNASSIVANIPGLDSVLGRIQGYPDNQYSTNVPNSTIPGLNGFNPINPLGGMQ